MSRLALKDAPVRRLLWTAGAALLVCALAVIALVLSAEERKSAFTPEPVFPGLGEAIGEVGTIELKDKDGETRIVFAPETGWVVPSENGAPARFDSVQTLAATLVELERRDKRTALAKWHERLELGDPAAGGAGRLVRLVKADGTAVAEILFGASATGDIGDGTEEVYARAPGEDQVYLVRGRDIAAISAAPADWVDRLLLEMPAARLARAEVTPPGGPAYTLVRPTPEDPNLTLETMPGGYRLRSVTAANGVSGALAKLEVKQATEADRIAFDETAFKIVYTTFDGLVLNVDVMKVGEESAWVRIAPSTTATASERAKREEAGLARRFAGKAFEIESWRYTLFAVELSDIIEPGAAAAPAKPAGTP